MTYSPTSAFWLFNQVSNFAYLRYNSMIKDIQQVQSELESNFIRLVKEQSGVLADQYVANAEKGIEALNKFSGNQANIMFNRWKSLSQYLLVKYMDGNIKKEKNGRFQDNGHDKHIPASPDQPRYPDWYYKAIIDQTGESLRDLTPSKN